MLKPLEVGRKKTLGNKCNGRGQKNRQTDSALSSPTQHNKLMVRLNKKVYIFSDWSAVSDKGKDAAGRTTKEISKVSLSSLLRNL